MVKIGNEDLKALSPLVNAYHRTFILPQDYHTASHDPPIAIKKREVVF